VWFLGIPICDPFRELTSGKCGSLNNNEHQKHEHVEERADWHQQALHESEIKPPHLRFNFTPRQPVREAYFRAKVHCQPPSTTDSEKHVQCQMAVQIQSTYGIPLGHQEVASPDSCPLRRNLVPFRHFLAIFAAGEQLRE
jgi:hypothetical protein